MSVRPSLKTTLLLLAIILLTLLFFWKILLTNLILVGVDTFLYFYPYKAYTAEALRQGRLPLWNPHLFMGAPLLANSQVGLFYPPNWLFIWLDAPRQISWSIGLHIALAGIFMLAYIRRSLGLGWAGGLAAAVLFAFGGYLGAQVEHINQLNAAVWLPLLFLLYDLAVSSSRRRWYWVLWLAAGVAITLLAGHAQTVFISLFGLGLYALWRTIFEPVPVPSNTESTSHYPWFSRYARSFIYHLWPLVLVSALAIPLAAIQLVPTAELSRLSIRSGGLTFREAVSFSLRPTNLHYTLLPPLNLDLSQVLGEAFGEWVAYLGVSGLILALLGTFRSTWQRPARRYLFLAASGLVLSLGLFSGPVYLALYTLVPGFNLFRVPARWLLLYAFSAAVLAGFGFDALPNPSPLRKQFVLSWHRLSSHRWRLATYIGLPALGLLALIAWKTPPAATLIAWVSLGALTAGLIYTTVRSPAHARRTTIALFMVLLLELFWAAQSLNYNRPTAPQAYHSMRNATAFLLAADPPDNPASPPSRFLSLSGITYDPGDLQELKQIFGDSLSPKALYNLIVATKEKEVLFFNLPMLYGLHTVDGYDGGILPLTQFVTMQELFLPADDLSFDGRLREKLRLVPPGRLLSLLNTRWIITDKQFDVWIDDIFYDLQFPARLAGGETIATDDIPVFPATAIGLVSHLEHAANLPDGTVTAELTLTFSDETSDKLLVKAGKDTAEGSYPSNTVHQQANIGVSWPYEAAGVDYIATYPVARPLSISNISLTATLPEGQFVLQGLSLIHEPTTTSRSVILSTRGDYRQVHSGDVKIYENLSVLPRAYVVHHAAIVPDEATAIETIKNPHFDPAQSFVRTAIEGEETGTIALGEPSPQDRISIISYQPERVEIGTTLDTPGWLILTDAYYPGWQVTIDGHPTEILRANIMFRAVKLPGGDHLVAFEFEPRSLQSGALISGLALVLLVAGLIVAFLKA